MMIGFGYGLYCVLPCYQVYLLWTGFRVDGRGLFVFVFETWFQSLPRTPQEYPH